MHNYSISNELSKESELKNQLVLERFGNAVAYNYWVPAKDLEKTTSATPPIFFVGSTNFTGEPSYWQLAKSGNTERLVYYMRRMPEWKKGMLYARPHYGIDVVNGDIVWGVSFVPVAAGTTFASSFVVAALPAPTVLNTIVATELTTTTSALWYCPISEASIGVSLVLDRRSGSASDTATGDVKLYGIELIYFEGIRDVGGVFQPNQRPKA